MVEAVVVVAVWCWVVAAVVEAAVARVGVPDDGPEIPCDPPLAAARVGQRAALVVMADHIFDRAVGRAHKGYHRHHAEVRLLWRKLAVDKLLPRQGDPCIVVAKRGRSLLAIRA